jgi:endonuclease/exonuclease/phosphatase (EEP) superfamily protein YafD
MTITATPAEVRPGRRVARTVLVAIITLPGLIWAVVRLFGWERGYFVPAIAFTPYVAAWSVIPMVISLWGRRWLIAAAAAVAFAVLAICVLPRAFPDADRGPSRGMPMTVMTINMYVGAADPASVVRLVRDNDVAILAVQEFSPHAKDGLAAAGLDTLLPYQALADEVGTTGSGLYSRFPMTGQGSRRGGGGNLQEGNLQAYATIRPPGATALNVQSAHPLAPYTLGALGDWRMDLRNEPHADSRGTPQILLGDFNSTLDHKPVRDLISTGYRDAADATGKGLSPTWGPWEGHKIPPVTLDHVLVDKRIGVRSVHAHAITGSDHRALIASLTVPTS